MTITEFHDIDDWDTFISFVRETDYYDFVDDVVSEDQMNELIEDNIRDYILWHGWQELVADLSSIDTGYDFYIKDRDTYFGYTPLTDRELYEWKADFEEHVSDDDNFWDVDDEQNDEPLGCPDEEVDFSAYSVSNDDEPDNERGDVFEAFMSSVMII